MRRRLRSTLLLTLAPLAAGCTDEPGLATHASGLYVKDSVGLWTDHNNTIPMCFLNEGFAAEKALIKDAVARSWTAVAAIDVVWRDGCPFTGEERWVRVAIRHPSGKGALDRSSADFGTSALSSPGDDVWCDRGGAYFKPCAGVALVLDVDGQRHKAEHAVIHEFGHLLGFRHEQERPEAEARRCKIDSEPQPGTTVGPYDRDSIMNYCGHGPNRLSEGDIAAVRAVYGFRADRRDQAADLDGDGDADPIATNVGDTFALSSTGFGFVDFRVLGGAFYGQRATLYGDVDGNGTADALAVNHDGIYVMTSDGQTLTWAGLWTTAPFYGDRRTLLGDVDGDGRDDVVAIDADRVAVAWSTGAGFLDMGDWSGSFYGSIQTDLADVDGDGKADLIANRGDAGLWVARSLGWRFGAPELWANLRLRLPEDRSTFNGQRALGFGDVDGDGKADAIAVRFKGIVVRRSTGAEFLPEEPWTRGPFFGDRATLFADVDGDKDTDVIAVNDDHLDVAIATGGELVPFGAPWTAFPFYSQP